MLSQSQKHWSIADLDQVVNKSINFYNYTVFVRMENQNWSETLGSHYVVGFKELPMYDHNNKTETLTVYLPFYD